MTDQPTALAELLAGLLPGRLPPPELLSAWRRAAGQTMARRALPVCLEAEGVLVVAVSGAAWRQELGLAGPALCGRLQEMGFSVRRLKLVSAPSPALPAAPPSAPLPELSAQEEAQVAAELKAVADPDLRQALEGLLRAALRARKAPGT
ncbi:MAG: DciA family protein [Thermodesulfobacteriota bacterium]